MKNRGRGVFYTTCFLYMFSDATMYAHFLFNAFDMDRRGSIRFEVRWAHSFWQILRHQTIHVTHRLHPFKQDRVLFSHRTSWLDCLSCSEVLYQRNCDGLSTCMISIKMVTSPKRYITSHKDNWYPDTRDCCMCLCSPAGNDGNNDIHLWYDGQVHPTHHSRWFPFWTRGEILSGIASTAAWKPLRDSLSCYGGSFGLFFCRRWIGTGTEWWRLRNS